MNCCELTRTRASASGSIVLASAKRLRRRALPGLSMLAGALAIAGALLEVGPAVAGEPQRPATRLTTDGQLKSDPVFIAGGEKIVFTLQETFNQLSLMQLRLSDGQLERFRPGVNSSHYAASFSADERRFAYLENDGNLHVKLVIHDAERAVNLAEYNPGGGFAGVRYLTMAPDASGLVFAFPERGVAQQLFWLSIDGQQRRVLTESDGFDACPRYSPDGRRLAFASTRDGNFDIFVMDLAGGPVRRLTDHEGFDSRPAWSPDGRRLVYTSLRDGNYDLFVINADGSGEQRLTWHEERDDFAWWHPNGRQVVAVCERDGQHDLYLLDAPP
ncbi:MAG: PD40 domain-containing protein [Pirellulaceae bacterium]|nr:PD40 domain-containing protein [Pirellulaceae bacterium]